MAGFNTPATAPQEYFSKRLKDENGYIAADEREIQKVGWGSWQEWEP